MIGFRRAPSNTVATSEATFGVQPALQPDPVRDLRLTQRTVSIPELLSAPTAVVAGVLGAWRLGADLGWTGPFFITTGLLSHHQFWFTVAIAVPWLGSVLTRRVPEAHTGLKTTAPFKNSDQLRSGDHMWPNAGSRSAAKAQASL